MLTIRKKLIGLFAGVLIVALGTVALVLVGTERSQITAQITENALNFSELSAERIAELYDLYYRSEADALFYSELDTLLARSSAVERVEIATATGELLFSTAVQRGESLPLITDTRLLARLKVNKLSLATAGRVAYLSRLDIPSHAAAYRFSDPEDQPVDQLDHSDRVETIVYPLADDTRRVVFHLSYDEVGQRVREAAMYLTILFLFGFMGSFLLATRFAGAVTAPLAALRAGAALIAKGKLDTRITVKTKDETKLLADTFNTMAADLSVAMDERVTYERTSRELELASEIQTSSLPREPVVPGLDFAVHFAPATQVGGDMYDVLPRQDDRTLFYLGDATGHGVPAGLVGTLMSAVMATVAVESGELPELIIRANRILHNKTKADMFATLLALEWNNTSKKISYLNAGHELPLIYRATSDKVEVGEKGTLGLGMLPELKQPVQSHTLELAQGEYLLAFTDGITEAKNATDELFGHEQLQTTFAEACRAGGSAEDVRDSLIAALAKWCGEIAPADDVTFFVIRLK